MTVVMLSNDLYGDTPGIVRSISALDASIEMVYTPPIGTVVDVCFRQVLRERSEEAPVLMTARAVVTAVQRAIKPDDASYPRIEFRIMEWS